MIQLKIDIEVMNHDKIIAQQKGRLAGMFAKQIPDAKGLVEKEIYNRIRQAIEAELKNELAKNGVKAKIAVY